MSFAEAPHLDGKHTVFGKVRPASFEVLDALELMGKESGETRAVCLISGSGQMATASKQPSDKAKEESKEIASGVNSEKVDLAGSKMPQP